MASVSVLPPSSDGTTNNYGNVTGLNVTRATTTTSSSSQLGPFITSTIDKNYSVTVGTSSDSSFIANDLYNMTDGDTSSGVKVTVSGVGGYYSSQDFTIQSPGTNLSVGSGPYTITNTSNSNVAVRLRYYYTRTTTTSTTTYTFTNNTGNPVTIEGTEIVNGSFAAIALDGLQFDITYTEYVQEESQEESQPVVETQTTTVVDTTVNVAAVYVYGTGDKGFGTGLTGYFYPLYTNLNAAALSSGYHVHTFTEYDGYTFYMPNNSMNHAVTSRPTSINKFITGIPELDNLEPTITNPNYAVLLPQIAAETDPTLKQSLIDQCYQFRVPLTQEEENLFAYINSGYIQDNPNATDGTPDTFISHVGIYYDEFGRTTATIAEQQNVVIQETEQTEETTEEETVITVAEYGTAEYGIAEYGA